MTKYPWANNDIKLQRSIERANQEGKIGTEREARVKQLYVSFGGKLVELETINEEEVMEDEKGNQATPGEVETGPTPEVTTPEETTTPATPEEPAADPEV